MSEHIEYVELRFTDLLGNLKAMIVPCNPAESLEKLKEDPVMKKGSSCDGSSVTGLASVEASDLRLYPDVSSLIELPYSIYRTAAVMCYVKPKIASEGKKDFFPLDSRGILQKVYDNILEDMVLQVKTEPEFHLITREGAPYDFGGYADTYPQNPGADILLEMSAAIREIGMEPRVIHHEVGKSQQEIEIDFEDARKMADYLIFFKNLARTIARNYDADVTFMPKPFEGDAGNGLHCHIQLWKGNTNLFGKDDGDYLSDTGKSFIAGLLKHAPAITAIANPTINSYKRLVPHHEAPVYISWGFRNRTVLVRVPLFNSAEKAAVEFRSSDPMANPYLLFSALIAGGMDGVRNNLEPPEPRSENIFNYNDEELEKLGITTLPTTLGEALDHLEKDKVIIEALGEPIIKSYIRLKRAEWEEYTSKIVTQWEWEKYY
ncbi:MAG: Glutamine synthetase [Candidatus Thorarchaeota archaeon]|nr:MAG: Glutamine synthetase [Candidatus Thorarchaeota archaeon]